MYSHLSCYGSVHTFIFTIYGVFSVFKPYMCEVSAIFKQVMFGTLELLCRLKFGCQGVIVRSYELSLNTVNHGIYGRR